MTLKDPILWLDLETDGVSREEGLTLEIGCVLTEGLDQYVSEIDVCINPKKHGLEEICWARMPDVVKRMHTGTGLWTDCLASDYNEGTAMLTVLEWMRGYGLLDLGLKSVTWGGKGVAPFDGPWLEHRMPDLHKWLRYWAFDVSPVRRIGKLAGINEPEFFQEGEKQHRAVDDAMNAWRAARWWRDVMYGSRNPGQFPRMEKQVKTNGG